MTISLEQQRINRKLWVEALRSGKYRQTKEALKRADGSMCCLGVLSELAGVEWHDDNERDGKFLASGHEQHTACDEAMAFVGLADREGAAGSDDDYSLNLADLNDNGATFSEIADIIESEPEGLFIESLRP